MAGAWSVRRLAAVGLCAAAAWSCGGGEEPPAPSGRALTAPQPAERQDNAAPVVERLHLSPRDPLPDVPVTAVVDVRDPDGDPLRVTYTWTVNGHVVAEGGHPGIGLDGARKGDRVEVVVVATDGRLESEPRRARAEVANRPPVVDAVVFEPEDVRPGDTLLASPVARDPDQDELDFEYTWLVNGAERGTGRALETGPLQRGARVRVRVVASDGEEESRPLESPEILLGNTPPRIARLPDVETESGVFRYQFEALDPDGDRNLRFWLEQAPEGMTVDPLLGVVTWRPEAHQSGVHPVEVGVKDSAGDGTTFLFEVTVSATPGEATPAQPPAAAE